MRKRNIITVAITVLIMMLSHNLWLECKPVDLNFSIKGIDNIFLEMRFSDLFIKYKSIQQNCNLTVDDNVHVVFDNIINFSRLKISAKFPPPNGVSYRRGNSPLVLSIPEVRNGKYKLGDIKRYSARNAEVMIVDNQLIIKPLADNFTIYYKIIGRASVNVYLELFIILLILTFLLSYKIVDYVADFKTIKNYSRIDIIFVSIFFILLFTPLSYINQDEVSVSENRMLAKWPGLLTPDKKLNMEFGKKFDVWFSDRFNTRELLVNLNSALFFDKSNSLVLFGKDDWLFYKGDNGVRNYQNLDLFNSQDLEKITSYLDSVDKYCKKNNKKFYLFIAPDKNRIYGNDYYPSYIKKFIPDTKSRAMQLINYLNENTDIKVIYPYSEFMNSKDDNLLYRKSDTHWTALGAALGYDILMNEIIKDNINVKKVDCSNTYEINIPKGDITRMLPLNKQDFDESSYKEIYLETKYSQEVTPAPVGASQWEIPLIVTENPDVNTPRVSMYRDSFSQYLIPFVSNTFQQVNYYWLYEAKKSEIDNADIIIIETVERFLPKLAKISLKD